MKLNVSSGILLYRRTDTGIEVFLVHPGGPFFRRKDTGFWSIPKGLIERGEDGSQTAVRELREEVGVEINNPDELVYLGAVKQKGGKTVYGYAYEYMSSAEIQINSNQVEIEFPPGTHNKLTFPEIDRGEWFAIAEAKEKINGAQVEFLEKLKTQMDKAGT